MSAGWSKAYAKTLAKEIRKSAGGGWAWMVPAVRRAVVAERVLMVVLGQDAQTVVVSQVQLLFGEVLVAATGEKD